MFALAACGGATTSVPASGDDGGGGGGGGDASTVLDGATGFDGGTLPDGATKPDASATVCKTDQDCNGIPQVSSLLGSCFQGICICNPGLHVQPNGKCSKTLPPPCMDSGGKCVQQPATCPSGTLESSNETNMSCGDLIAAACCFDAASCVGPQFTCCAPNDAGHAPICENGYRTCPAGFSPVGPGGGCG